MKNNQMTIHEAMTKKINYLCGIPHTSNYVRQMIKDIQKILLFNQVIDQQVLGMNDVVATFHSIDLEIDCQLPNWYKELEITFVPKKKDYRFCCQKKMTIDEQRNILVCWDCGRSHQFRDTMFSKGCNNVIKERKVVGNPLRNFHKWIGLLTEVNPEMKDTSQLIISQCQTTAKRNDQLTESITIKEIRLALKQLKLTKFNNFMASFLCFINGVKLPEFNYQDIDLITKEYQLIMNLYSRSSQGINMPYCPYVICKIIENVFNSADDKQRLINFIHIQGPSAQKKFNDQWKIICAKINYVYSPISYE